MMDIHVNVCLSFCYLSCLREGACKYAHYGHGSEEHWFERKSFLRVIPCELVLMFSFGPSATFCYGVFEQEEERGRNVS